MSLVEVSELSRNFGRLKAVQEVSFAFEAGEIFGFIGPNGAGKSTAMRILATLDLPSAGDCRVAGMSCVDDADKVRPLIGYMPDSFGAYPNMTVGDYIDFFARAYDLHGDERQRAVDATVDFCQLGGLIDKPVTTLSKGMKQRLCLGRCLVHDPQVLILDEPSAGLDPRARIEFRDLLRILARQGKAIFISSHILAELEELCSSVAIIELGRLVATGRVSEIKARLRERHLQQHEEEQDDDQGQVIEILLYTPHERTASILAEQPEVLEQAVDGHSCTITVRGTPAQQGALLKRLIEAGLPICRFAGRDQNLEDVFLQLTEGKVQ